MRWYNVLCEQAITAALTLTLECGIQDPKLKPSAPLHAHACKVRCNIFQNTFTTKAKRGACMTQSRHTSSVHVAGLTLRWVWVDAIYIQGAEAGSCARTMAAWTVHQLGWDTDDGRENNGCVYRKRACHQLTSANA